MFELATFGIYEIGTFVTPTMIFKTNDKVFHFDYDFLYDLDLEFNMYNEIFNDKICIAMKDDDFILRHNYRYPKYVVDSCHELFLIKKDDDYV